MQCGDVRHVDGARGLPLIICGLHPDPETRPIPEEFAQTHPDFRADRLALGENVIKMLPGNPEQPCNLGFAPLCGGNNVFAQQCAWMRRAATNDASHAYLLMVLFKVKNIGVAA
ncbi:hypothetical protein AA23498_0733 [Acetobacter nitrogenifigens DSM 23921 = NBRC 105050]|nr:hypothetical protein AA23498_0733 [Acetobacter nitrogenifigens DSM 23921 = NBRC 105050]